MKSHTYRFSLTPSPRRSLHVNCVNCYANMVRYGLKNNRDECDGPPQRVAQPSVNSVTWRHLNREDDSRDEVDNVMSKMANRSFSPPRFSPNRNVNSSAGSLKQPTIDNSDIMSTSLPATLPSYSRYSLNLSNEDVFRSNNSDSQGIITSEDGDSDEDQTRIKHRSSTERMTKQSPIQTRRMNQNKESKDEQLYSTFLPVLFLVITILLYYMYTSILKENLYSEVNFGNDLRHLGEKFLNQYDPIIKIQSGILTISKREDAGSFIFVYNSNNPLHNEDKFNNFVNDVAAISAKYLRNQSTEVHHIVIDKTDLRLSSHGELIGRYRNAMENQGVLLVNKLQDVPTHLAMAFHYYCDEYNPLVKKSAIFFTLDLRNCQSEYTYTTHRAVEKCLSEVWRSLPVDNLGPLLTRVVNVVVNVNL